MGNVPDFIDSKVLLALDLLHDACIHVRRDFSLRMSRSEAQANLESRAILFTCANRILKEHGCGIARNEVV